MSKLNNISWSPIALAIYLLDPGSNERPLKDSKTTLSSSVSLNRLMSRSNVPKSSAEEFDLTIFSIETLNFVDRPDPSESAFTLNRSYGVAPNP